jgi:hypothetical protein
MLKHSQMNRFKEVQTRDETIQGSPIPPPPKGEKSVPSSPPFEIQFDWDEIEQKNKELERIKDQIDALEEETENLTTEHEPNTKVNHEDDSVISVGVADSKRLKPVSLTDAFSMGERQKDWEEFVEELSPLEQEFLLLFVENRLSKSKANDFLKSKGKMLSVFLSDLNEKAIEFIEDVLVEETEEDIELLEDYAKLLNLIKEGTS